MYVDNNGEYSNNLLEPYTTKDGSYALLDSYRDANYDGPFHSQFLVITTSNSSYNLNEGSIGLGKVEVDCFTIGWE